MKSNDQKKPLKKFTVVVTREVYQRAQVEVEADSEFDARISAYRAAITDSLFQDREDGNIEYSVREHDNDD